MLLCVDADADARSATASTLRDAGYDVTEAASIDDARDRLNEIVQARAAVDEEELPAPEIAVDVVVTEQDLPDGTGLELMREVRETTPDTSGILYTDVPVDDIDTAAFGDVVAEYLRKDGPGAETELLGLVEQGFAFNSQTAYPLPENEDARLAALERYAVDPDSLGDSFDRLTEIATETFGVNASAVGLIDAHEQRFLGCHGIAFEPMDREDTVCTYAILDSNVTVIEDVTEDPRFSENEGLAATGIRFYASAAIETPTGEVIGTFCVYDDAPREFSTDDEELLTLFADEAMDQLTLRRRLRGDADE